jgi:osmotically-inducible protein OsmY
MADDRRTDDEVQRDVVAELAWDARVLPDGIGVAVQAGVVTLTGTVGSFHARWAAEQAALRVRGARAVVNDLAVELPSSTERPDPEIAEAVLRALDSEVLLRGQSIDVTVSRGWVSLKGAVDWNFLRDDAGRVVRGIWGVKGVTNLLTVKPRPMPSELEQDIHRALVRNAELDASLLQVEAAGGKVVLKGRVRSWAEREAAARVAWQAPGVTEVDNQVEVAYG